MSDSKDDGGAAPGRRRRSWTLDEKRRIIDESLEDGVIDSQSVKAPAAQARGYDADLPLRNSSRSD
jgi:transposase-like protein